MGATPVRALNSIKRDGIGGVANNPIEWFTAQSSGLLPASYLPGRFRGWSNHIVIGLSFM